MRKAAQAGDWQRCAALVEKGDPDRFAAAMMGPLAARRVLFPLYAFNLEVARAPWASKEPMIAEMRLQWWRDMLDDIANGKAPQPHEVASPLADILDGPGARLLDRLVAARRWDIYDAPFDDPAHFAKYLEDTSGALMWAAARALGAPETAQSKVLRLGAALGLARYFQAIPRLEAAGKTPLLDGRPEAVRALAQEARQHMKRRPLRRAVGRSAAAALTEAWSGEILLGQVHISPRRVAADALAISPLQRALALWRWS